MNRLDQVIELGYSLLKRITGEGKSVAEIDWKTTIAVSWHEQLVGGSFHVIGKRESTSLDDLLEIDRQKIALVENTDQFVRGLPANNALLWGARGTGKSSLIHALLPEFSDRGLRLVEVAKEHFTSLPTLIQQLPLDDYKFVVVMDDLSFSADDDSYKHLKSLLEGSQFSAAQSMLIYATSNRRHLVAESMRDNLQVSHIDGELHESEAVEEKISLSDRFGLWLSFHPFSQEQYLNVVRYWLHKLASENGITVEWDEGIEKQALTWALNRAVRSGRTSHQFATYAVGRRLLMKS